MGFASLVLRTCCGGVGQDGEGADVLRSVASGPGKERPLRTGQRLLREAHSSRRPPAKYIQTENGFGGEAIPLT